MTREYTEITVIGADKTGLIANITTLLFERGINVEDLDQAVREGIFRMTLHADTADMETSRSELREALEEMGEELDVEIRVRFPSERDAKRIAVLCTKESHCLEAIFESWANDDLGAEVGVVIANRPDLRPLAERYDVPFHDVGDESGAADEDELLALLEEYDADLIVLARYMRILSPEVVFRYEDRIINIHPSLLPAFPGAAAYRQAKEEGVRVAGVTAHYVTTDLDQGPIITQRAFDVPDDPTVAELKERGQPLEAEALIEAIRLHLRDELAVHWGRTNLRTEEAAEEYQLGLPSVVEEANPDRPVDGTGAAVRDAAGDDAAEAPGVDGAGERSERGERGETAETDD